MLPLPLLRGGAGGKAGILGVAVDYWWEVMCVCVFRACGEGNVRGEEDTLTPQRLTHRCFMIRMRGRESPGSVLGTVWKLGILGNRLIAHERELTGGGRRPESHSNRHVHVYLE